MSITVFIIILTAAVSITAFNNSEVFYRMKFNAFLIRSENGWYRFLSYGLLHADWAHLIINMFVLFSFGRLVEASFENLFGAKAIPYFLLLYVGGLIFSVIASYIKNRNNSYYNAVGASGAVSAVLFASIIMHPEGQIIMLLFPVPIPAFVFGILYLIYSAYMAKRASDNVGHDAHFWGAVYGILLTIILRPRFLFEFLDYVFF